MGLLNWLSGASKPTAGRFGKDRYKPSGVWVQTTMMVSVAGTSFRRPQAASFANAVRRAERSGARYGVRLSPEPSNPHDANAIAVYGAIDDRSWHVGYLDRETAEEITRDLVSQGVPIAAELYEIWVGSEGHIDIKIIVLAPSGHGVKARMRRWA